MGEGCHISETLEGAPEMGGKKSAPAMLCGGTRGGAGLGGERETSTPPSPLGVYRIAVGSGQWGVVNNGTESERFVLLRAFASAIFIFSLNPSNK